jgi:hypothetical protein
MVDYIHAPGVIGQRDIRLHGHASMREALEAIQDSVGPEESVLALSFDGRLFELNTVGALLWEELRRPRSPQDIADVLADLFDLDGPQAGADARSFLDEMSARGLIRSAAPEGSTPGARRIGA